MLKYYSKEFSKINIRGKFILSFLLIIAGLVTLFYVTYPIISFQLYYGPKLTRGNFIFPIPDVLATSIPFGEGTLNLSGIDYSRASNWFPTAPHPDSKNKNSLSSYFLSIPKLGIKEAVVSTVSDDLFKNLIHYSGSSLPGQPGNAVVFGHSTLPQFFDPKNYKTIFATLHTLKIGDKITVNIDGVIYRYSIFEIKVIESQDVSVLEQQYDGSYITLITCTPPGTYWKRLVIKANLEKLDST